MLDDGRALRGRAHRPASPGRSRRRPDLRDPRVTYMLHEIGEEARHSRAFIRLIDELGPTAAQPDRPAARELRPAPHRPGRSRRPTRSCS